MFGGDGQPARTAERHHCLACRDTMGGHSSANMAIRAHRTDRRFQLVDINYVALVEHGEMHALAGFLDEQLHHAFSMATQVVTQQCR